MVGEYGFYFKLGFSFDQVRRWLDKVSSVYFVFFVRRKKSSVDYGVDSPRIREF
jgi:hypothetical protein